MASEKKLQYTDHGMKRRFMAQNTRKYVSYYDVLAVGPHSSDEEIKRAYHRLALRFHPDRNPHNRTQAEKYFRVVSDAYTQLKTRELRARYDRNLKLRRAETRPAPPRAGNDNGPGRGGWLEQIFSGLFRASAPSGNKRSA